MEAGRGQGTLQEAFAALASGDADALGAIYDLAAADLFGFALWLTGSRSDAEDAVQDSFVRLARSRADLGAVRNPKSYLLSIAHRVCAEQRRRPRPVPLDESLCEPLREDHDARLDAARVNDALLGLPAEQREAVYLRHFGEMSFAEVGAVTGVSLFTAASRCRLGLARLRKQMGVRA